MIEKIKKPTVSNIKEDVNDRMFGPGGVWT
jgi:hypothetical protein